MANNSKMNGAMLGIAFGLLGLLAIKGMQGAVGSENFWNTIYSWFTSGAQAIIDAWAPLASIGVVTMAFVIAGLIGLIVGLYVEMK